MSDKLEPDDHNTQPKKRGRKKKQNNKLLEQHLEEQQKILQRLSKLTLESETGKALKDLILILIALDAQATSIHDMFDCYASDIFRSIRT